MNFDEYQTLAHQTAGERTQANAIMMSVLGLCGESGEIADLIKKCAYHGHTLERAKLVEEIGDVLWYLAELCTAHDIALVAVAIRNIEKLKLRYPEGFSNERSINRKME